MRSTTHVPAPPHKSFLDILIYFIATLGPLSSLPQIIEIWVVEKSAKGVSLSTWTMFMLMSVVWLCYGVKKRDTPLVVSNSLWIIMDLIIMAGAFFLDDDLI